MPGVTLKQTCTRPVRHLQNDERLHVPDTGYPTPTRANLHPVRNTEIICAKPSMCFFKQKERKLYEPPENESPGINSVV